MNISNRLWGELLCNYALNREALDIGFEYIVNPRINELHYVQTPNFLGSHNLTGANLDEFIGLFNVGAIPMHKFHNGILLPIFDSQTGEELGQNALNKCKHCTIPE